MSAARASMAPPALLGFVALAQGGAIVLAVVAWNGSATKASPTGQISWAAVAALAVAVSGTVNALWLGRSRRVVGLRQRQVIVRIQEVGDQYGPSPAPGTGTGGDITLVAVDGMSLYHRVGCVLMHGRPGARAGRAPDRRVRRAATVWLVPARSD